MADNLSASRVFSGKAVPEMKVTTRYFSYVALDGDSPVLASSSLPDD
jgi:hypothetical protein